MYTGNTYTVPRTVELITVYPCVYREHIQQAVFLPPQVGLSLCIQGTLSNWGHDPSLNRFIPVYTGNTHSNQSPFNEWAVYPCVYREHPIVISPSILPPGLSLCIQGTLVGVQKVGYFQRFIPVYTGNTAVSTVITANLSGLSLCIQGTPQFITSIIIKNRFIPVYTGNTFFNSLKCSLETVYPCVYREHI